MHYLGNHLKCLFHKKDDLMLTFKSHKSEYEYEYFKIVERSVPWYDVAGSR